MAVWNRDHRRQRLDATTSADETDTVANLVSGASILGLATIALVPVLAWMLLSRGPDFGRAELGRSNDAPSYAADEMAGQRFADITAQRQLDEARAAASSPPDLIDAHVSSYQPRAAR
jgi:hypothetical protein